jgi:hypothetical protein
MPEPPDNAALASLPPAQRLAKAVLLFMRPHGPWFPEDYAQWKALTGNKLVVVQALRDLANTVLEARHE